MSNVKDKKLWFVFKSEIGGIEVSLAGSINDMDLELRSM